MRLNINGETRELHAEPGTPLLWALREYVGLTGTKYGCGIGQCGACTIHIDGMAVRSCSVSVEAVEPAQKIVTIEGLGKEGLHPVQQAWLELDVPQCGYCQSGMIMAAAALLAEHPDPDVDTIVEQITNICRCGTYNRVVAAIRRAASSSSISDALRNAGIVWSDDNLDRFLQAPQKFLTGTTMMISLPQARDRADVIAYLKTLDPAPTGDEQNHN